MSFQPRGTNKNFNKHSANNDQPSHGSMHRLVDQITEAVRERLIAQGLPTSLLGEGAAFSSHIAPGTFTSESERTITNWKLMRQTSVDRIGQVGGTPFEPHSMKGEEGLAAKIDHTLLKPDATPDEIKRICEEARNYHFATVCVNSANIELTAKLLQGSSVKPIAVVGFPLGAASSSAKAFETRESVRLGAKEIDMVINIGALKAKEYDHVLKDIEEVVRAAAPYPVKVILETSNLNSDEKIIACALSKAAGAAFVKTSTGFGSGGATVDDVALMRRIVGPEMGVKASGGIRSHDDAVKMIAAGATRIGASASVAIVTHKDSAKSEEKSEKDPSKKGYKNSLY